MAIRPCVCEKKRFAQKFIDRQTDGRTDDGRRAIALAHSWNELKIETVMLINSAAVVVAILMMMVVVTLLVVMLFSRHGCCSVTENIAAGVEPSQL